MGDLLARLTHPAFRTGAGAVVGYGLILAALLVAIYLVPYAAFRLL